MSHEEFTEITAKLLGYKVIEPDKKAWMYPHVESPSGSFVRGGFKDPRFARSLKDHMVYKHIMDNYGIKIVVDKVPDTLVP